MKKWLTSSMALVLVMSITAACGKTTDNGSATTSPAGTNAPATTDAGGAANASVKGKITVVTHRTDLVDTKFKEWTDAFKKKYPGVTEVAIESIKDYGPTMKVRLSTGELGDVNMIPDGVPNNKLAEYYAPLNDLGLNDKVYFPDIKASDGKTLGLPSGVNTNGVAYNKQAFAKAGITSVPKTLDELYAAAEKLKTAGITPLATNFKDKWPLSEWDIIAFEISGDPEFRGSMTKTDAPFAEGTPYNKALTILKTFVTKGYTEKDLMSTDWESSKKDVASGKTAMYFLGNWVIPQIIENGAKSEDIGFFPMPYDNSGKYNANMGPDYMYGVAKNSKNIDTAKAFVKFMIEESDYADYAGMIPPLKSKVSTMPQLKEFLAMKPNTLQGKPDPDAYSAIANKAQIDFMGGTYVQKLVLAKDFKAGLEELNKKWADAKKAVGQ
ncbi:extracellular solute-binding protein [Paenibacillus sp. HWE-109]|uniref:ABC transporter substrate-binding protein n=1 Tax=Paenibacillus sp. HWE-109 TaxID=1306526 RepID=UPI001EDD389B|nr:extracellular solute-binding protein [Paenibacillus sp. HWE-109]UKS26785.1 extracellular solute-binding protein [Paenibacillus sp. HWE-109]